MISIIIPTLNEAKNLEALFKRISKLHLDNYEIIIADSNSKDNTISIAKYLASKYRLPVKAIQTGNTDLANAVIRVLPKARGNIIAVIDADLQHPPEIIPKMLKKLKKSDIVIASRFIRGAKVNFGLERVLVSKVYRFLAHFFVSRTKNIKDPGSGFFVFRKKILDDIALKPLGFKILLEILAKANYKTVIEIPYRFGKRKKGKSKFNLRQAALAFIHLLKLAKHSREHGRILKFLAAGQ